jgi:predicted signal transduction protein with EAL and GGDEF domain
LALLLAHPYPQVINIFSDFVAALIFGACSLLLSRSIFNEPLFTGLLCTVFLVHSIVMLVQGVHYLASDTRLMQMGSPDSAIVATLLSHIMLTTLTALLLPWLSFLQTERKLTLKSQQDGMTNLSNRCHFFALVEQYWIRHPHKPLVIMMIDIDHLKTVNDQFGHMVGDKVIKGVADILSTGLRSHDILGRVGG